MNKIIAFIPAKGRSTRLPNKNILELGDKPLFCHAIENAFKSELIDRVVVDSDSDVILSKGAQMGTDIIKRPPYLATNEADGNDLAFWEANNYKDSEIIVQLAPTSPFIKPESIDRAIRILINGKIDSVAGVFSDLLYQWENDRPSYLVDDKIPNSFDMKPIMYETMGLCVTRTEFALTHRKRLNTNSCLPCYLSKIEAIDINNQADFDFAQIVWRGLNFK